MAYSKNKVVPRVVKKRPVKKKPNNKAALRGNPLQKTIKK
tara:strand:- start:483 stop:602 length:120 start_codon:yes stop_codon:yes gene_type:complete